MLYQKPFFIDAHSASVLRTFSFMLSASIGVAVGGLFSWHTFLVVTGQGTIDFVENFRSWKQAYQEGRPWSNPYNLGFVKNFKVTLLSHSHLIPFVKAGCHSIECL